MRARAATAVLCRGYLWCRSVAPVPRAVLREGAKVDRFETSASDMRAVLAQRRFETDRDRETHLPHLRATPGYAATRQGHPAEPAAEGAKRRSWHGRVEMATAPLQPYEIVADQAHGAGRGTGDEGEGEPRLARTRRAAQQKAVPATAAQTGQAGGVDMGDVVIGHRRSVSLSQCRVAAGE